MTARLANIKIGTTKEKVVAILGEPEWIERVKSDKFIVGMTFFFNGIQLIKQKETLERAAKENIELVEYSYSLNPFISPPIGIDVYFDQTGQRTVLLPTWTYKEGGPRGVAVLIFILSIALLAVLTYLVLRLWCARTMKSADLATGPQPGPFEGRKR